MSMTYAELEQAMEDSNFAACRAAFVATYPNESPFASTHCEDGEWACPTCPFKSPDDNNEEF